MVNYCAASELKDRLCLTGNERDYAIDSIVAAASRWVDKETARRFYTVSETRYYSVPRYSSFVWPSDISERPGGGAQGVPIDDVVDVTLLATDEDGDRVYEQAWTFGTDYWLEPLNAVADGLPYRRIERNGSSGRYFFPQVRGGIAVTGTFGYSSSTPEPIRELALIVAEIMAQPILDMTLPGVESYKIGSSLSVSISPANLPSFARTILQQYKDPNFQ